MMLVIDLVNKIIGLFLLKSYIKVGIKKERNIVLLYLVQINSSCKNTLIDCSKVATNSSTYTKR